MSDDHGLQMVSTSSNCITPIGKKGSGPLQFKQPAGIAIAPLTEQVYVADRGNHRIQVLNPNLTFFHSFGSKGSGVGEFRSPSDVAIDSEGIVYVTDRDNHRIQKFAPNGKFLSQFAVKQILCKPAGIAIDTAGTGLVYVSSHENNCVSIFTSEGVFVRMFGRSSKSIGKFSWPRELAFDKEGFLYICDHLNDRLVIY